MALPNLQVVQKKREEISNPYWAKPIRVDRSQISSPYWSYEITHKRSMIRGRKKEYEPPELTQRLDTSSSYMFDYNNPNEVNSHADVLLRTITSIGDAAKGIIPWAEVANQTIDDLKQVIYRGSIAPIKGYIDKELSWADAAAILLSNQLVSFSENVDLVDNIYKGFVLNGGLQDWDKGVEGVQKAIFERVNFDFDTGNKFKDLVLELLTPTNIALAIGSLGMGSIAKTAFQETTEEVSKKTLKSFVKTYKGDIAETFMKMPQQLTSLEMKALTDIAEHSLNLKLIKNLNIARGTIDFIDKAGPVIAIQSTVGIPWKVMKGVYGMSSHMTRYVANTVESFIEPGEGMVSILRKQPELQFILNNLAEAGKLNDETMAPYIKSEVLKTFANKDRKAIRAIIKEFDKIKVDDKLIKSRMREILSGTGVVMEYPKVQQELMKEKFEAMYKALDAKISELTAGQYKTFEEYYALVTNLNQLSDMTKEVDSLYKLLQNIETQKRTFTIYKHQSAVGEVLEKIKLELEMASDTNDYMKLAEDYKHKLDMDVKEQLEAVHASLKRLGSEIEHTEILGKASKRLSKSLTELTDVEKNIERVKALMKKNEKVKGYDMPVMEKKLKAYTDMRTKLKRMITNDNHTIKVLENKLKKIDSLLDQELKLYNYIDEGIPVTILEPLGRDVNEAFFNDIVGLYRESKLVLQNLYEDAPTVQEKSILNRFKNLMQEATKEAEDIVKDIKKTIKETDVAVKETIQIDPAITYQSLSTKYADGLAELQVHLMDTIGRLSDIPAEIIGAETLASGIDKLAKSLYGGDMPKFMDDMIATMESKLETLKTDNTINKINDTLFDTEGKYTHKIDTFIRDLQIIGDMDSIEAIDEAIGGLFTNITRDGESVIESIALDFNDALDNVREFVNKYFRTDLNAFGFGLKDTKGLPKELADIVRANQDIGKATIPSYTGKAVKATSDEIAELLDSIAIIRNGLKIAEENYNKIIDEEVVSKLKPTQLGLDLKAVLEEPVDIVKGLEEKLSKLKETYTEISRVHLKDERLPNLSKEIEDLKYRLSVEKAILKETQEKEFNKLITERVAPAKDIISTTEMSKSNLIPKMYKATEDILDMFEFTADEILEFSKENIKKYRIQSNATYRNLFILRGEEINKILDAVEHGFYEGFEAIESLEAISKLDTSKLNYLIQEIQTPNLSFNRLNELYKAAVGVELSTDVTQDALKAAVDTIIATKKSAMTMMDTLEGMVSVRKLYGAVQDAVEGGLDKSIAHHFLDAIQRMYNEPALLASPKEFAEYARKVDWRINSILDNVNNQLRNDSLKYSVKLDRWAERIEEMVKYGELPEDALNEFNELFGSKATAHTAIADAYSEYLIHKYIFKDELMKGKKFAYIDIETSGTNKAIDIIHQVSFVVPEDNTYKWIVNTDVPKKSIPEDHVLYLLFGDEKHQFYTIDRLRESYKKIYWEGNLKEFERYFSMGERVEIIGVKGEKSLLETLQQTIDAGVADMATKSGRVARSYDYRMHNGIDFDAPFINKRANVHGLNFRIPMERIDDTKIRLEKKLGIKVLSQDETDTLRDIVYDYIRIRENELSANRLQNIVGHVEQQIYGGGERELGKFLPTIDTEFRQAYADLREIFDPASVSEAKKAAAKYFDESSDLFKKLGNSFEELNDSLLSLKHIDAKLKRHILTVNPEIVDYSSRIIPESFYEGIEKTVRLNNVGADIATMNTFDGVYIPLFAVKSSVDNNLAVNFFPQGMGKMSYKGLERVNETARTINKIAGRLRNLEYLEGMPIDVMHKFHKQLVDEMSTIAGDALFNPILKSLKYQDSESLELATIMYLYNRYKAVVRASHMPITPFQFEYAGTTSKTLHLTDFIKEITTKENFALVDVLEYPKIVTTSKWNQVVDPNLFHTLIQEGEMETVTNVLRDLVNKEITTLEGIETLQEELGFSRLKAIMPIYRDMLDSFEHTKSAIEILTDVDEAIIGATGKSEFGKGWQSGVYNQLRVMEEAFDAGVSFQKLRWFLELSPDEMVSYIRHQGKGLVVFKNSNLDSANYFPTRNYKSLKPIFEGDLNGLYNELFKNKALYEEKGLTFNFTAGYTTIYIKDVDMPKLKDIPYTRITEDFGTQDVVQAIIDKGTWGNESAHIMQMYAYDEVSNVIESLSKARRKLTALGVDANKSTLEVLDDIEMEKLLVQMDTLAPGHATLKTLNEFGILDGNYFNHSVLGHVDTRREFMQFSAFNLAKTMFHATTLVQKHLDAQIAYINMMQAPEFMLSNVVKHMTPQEIVSYLKKSPHLRVAFLNGNKAGTDFKLSTVVIKNAKDIDFAVKMNAIVIDRMTYATAYSVINRYKIKNPVLRFLDRALVASFKIGWLAWNPGVVGRNIFDTSLKNMTTTKDMEMIESMVDMTINYSKYKNVESAIYKLASEKKLKPEAAVELYFKQGKSPLARETYDLIREYVKAGGTTTKTQEAMKYYGDAVTKMFKRIGAEESGITLQEFKEILKMPDEVAESWLKRKLTILPEVQDLVMRTKNDHLVYKRAYKMNELYKGQDLPVETLITYLKSGRIPDYHQEVFKDLLYKTRKITIEKDFLQKLMDHPVVANSLSANMYTEETLRLAMYKYLRDQGLSPAKAMGEIEITHFNYDKKNKFQILMEMAMPFSTFRMNSLMYWAEHLSESPNMVEILGDTWGAVSRFNEREHTDVLLRRSLRYQMYTGNVILDEETGLTLKLNPSVLDTLNFFANPIDYIVGTSHSGMKALRELVTARQESWESEEAFKARKLSSLFNLVPFLGTYANRYNAQEYQLKKAGEDPNPTMSLVKALLIAPMFNTTWTPAQSTYKPYDLYTSDIFRKPKYENYYKAKRTVKYAKRTSYPKFVYGHKDWSNYSTFNRTYYSAYFKFRRGSAYPTKNFRSLNTAFSDMWRRSMTKKGNPKYRFLSFPTNKWTRDLKIGILRNITSYYRWQ